MDIKDHPIFADCYKKMYRSCLCNLKKQTEKMTEDDKKAAMSRFDWEMDIIAKNRLEAGFYLMKNIIDYCYLLDKPAFLGMNTPYAYVSFLYGLTQIDTFRHGYNPVFAYRITKDDMPFMILEVSNGGTRIIQLILRKTFGENLVTYDKFGTISIGDGCGTDNEYYSGKLNIYVHENQLLTRLENSFQIGSEQLQRYVLTDNDFDLDVDIQSLKKIISEYILTRDADKEIKENIDMFIDDFIVDGTDEELVKCIGCICGKGLWEKGKKPTIITRDELLLLSMKVFCDSVYKASYVAENIGKGKIDNPHVKELLDEYDKKNVIRSRVNESCYMLCEGAILPLVRLVKNLAGFE